MAVGGVTGLAPGFRVCPTHGVRGKRTGGRINSGYWLCRACATDRMREWRHRHLERSRAASRRYGEKYREKNRFASPSAALVNRWVEYQMSDLANWEAWAERIEPDRPTLDHEPLPQGLIRARAISSSGRVIQDLARLDVVGVIRLLERVERLPEEGS